MNKKEIQKYFDRRPAAQELYVVGSIVFINADEAQTYADHSGLVVETKHRDDPDDDAFESLNEGDVNAEEKREQAPSPAKKKNVSRKNLGK